MAKKSKKSSGAIVEATPQPAREQKQEQKKTASVVTAGASLADAFAQSAAFFGKKTSYAAPDVVEPPADSAAVTEDAQLSPPVAVEGEPEEKKSKKKKKDRKRKREQVDQDAEEATSGENTADAADGDEREALETETDNKSERTIFVGNVSLDATQSALKTFFSTCGKVEKVRLRFLPVAGTAVNDHGNQKLVMKVCANQKIFTDKRDFCHAYVTFAEKESVEKAMLMNRTLFMNKTLRIDHENPRVDPQRSVFVGNLSFSITDEAVWSFFDKHLSTEEERLPVENVRVIRDRETGAGKGFAYVLLKGKALAAKALSLSGKKLQNRELRVQVCGKRTKNKKGEDAALKHEGRRASGAAGRILTKKKARGELVALGNKEAKIARTKSVGKPLAQLSKKPTSGKKTPATATTGKAKNGITKGKVGAKSKKVRALAPGVEPKKPKHAARKARQAAEAAAAAKNKK